MYMAYNNKKLKPDLILITLVFLMFVTSIVLVFGLIKYIQIITGRI